MLLTLYPLDVTFAPRSSRFLPPIPGLLWRLIADGNLDRVLKDPCCILTSISSPLPTGKEPNALTGERKCLPESDTSMCLRQTLYSITRAIHDQYDAYPADLDEAREVRRYLVAEGHTDRETFCRLAALSLRTFIQVEIDSQWRSTEDSLWNSIRLKSQKTADKPEFWGPDASLLDLAIYVDISDNQFHGHMMACN